MKTTMRSCSFFSMVILCFLMTSLSFASGEYDYYKNIFGLDGPNGKNGVHGNNGHRGPDLTHFHLNSPSTIIASGRDGEPGGKGIDG